MARLRLSWAAAWLVLGLKLPLLRASPPRKKLKVIPGSIPEPDSGLLIIGAGLPRTGTQTLSAALTLLGYKVNHGGACNPPGSGEDSAVCQMTMCDWFRGGSFEPVVQQINGTGAHAVTDEPYCVAYKELAEAFPRAKVILTVRDSPAQWTRSFAEMQEALSVSQGTDFTQANVIRKGDYWFQCDQFSHLLFDCDFYTEKEPEEVMRECRSGYIRYNNKVIAAIDPDRLLVFNVKEGWGPLVDFLGHPMPWMPFPRVENYVKGLQFYSWPRGSAKSVAASFAGATLTGLLFTRLRR